MVLSARDGSNRHLYQTAGVGYFGFTEWSSDESTVTIPTGDDVFVGKGDGSDLRQQTFDHFQSTRGRAFAWRPDGSAYLYLWGPPTGSCASFCVSEHVDVWAQPVDGGDATNLTNVVPGDLVVAAAVSPDGRSLALLKKHADPTGDPYAFSQAASALPAELWIRDATGAGRRIETPNLLPIDYGRDMPYSIHWSPDGGHLAIEVSNGRRGAETSTDTYLVPLDGSTVAVLHDAREAAWSPDGTLIAFMHQTGPSSRLENDPVPPRTIEVAASDGSARRQVARPTGDLDAGYFVWAPS